MRLRRPAKNVIYEQAEIVRNSLLKRYKESAGWCCEASCVLREFLHREGVKTTLIEGRVEIDKRFERNLKFHYWLEHAGKILDITGDQFNFGLPSANQIPGVLYAPYRCYRQYHKDQEANAVIMFNDWAVSMTGMAKGKPC